MTLNVHSLLHLTASVRDLGPLWVHSCFAFEDANGRLTKYFHGTQYIDIQIASALNILQTMPQLAVLVPKDSEAAHYLDKLCGKSKQLQSSEKAYPLGAKYEKILTNDILRLVNECLGRRATQLEFHNRLRIGRTTYHSVDNTRVLVRNSYTCKYYDNFMNEQFGFIQWFAKAGETVICCIQQQQVCEEPLVEDDSLHVNPPHIHKTHRSNIFQVIDIANLINMCVCVPSCDYDFICEQPNDKELNM